MKKLVKISVACFMIVFTFSFPMFSQSMNDDEVQKSGIQQEEIQQIEKSRKIRASVGTRLSVLGISPLECYFHLCCMEEYPVLMKTLQRNTEYMLFQFIIKVDGSLKSSAFILDLDACYLACQQINQIIQASFKVYNFQNLQVE